MSCRHGVRCAVASRGSKRRGIRSRANTNCCSWLETEDALDLVPEREKQRERERNQHDDRDHETQSRAGSFAVACDLGASLCTVEAIRSLDRGRIERWLFARRRAAGWLGHPRGYWSIFPFFSSDPPI